MTRQPIKQTTHNKRSPRFARDDYTLKTGGLKTRKQVLMQQLLTGKRRVALEDGAISQ